MVVSGCEDGNNVNEREVEGQPFTWINRLMEVAIQCRLLLEDI